MHLSENIAFGLYKDQIDMEKVMECSRKAMIESDSQERKNIIQILEGGVKLSGG